MICYFCGKDVVVEQDYEQDDVYLCPECAEEDEKRYNEWMDSEFGQEEAELKDMICTGNLAEHPGFLDYLIEDSHIPNKEGECG